MHVVLLQLGCFVFSGYMFRLNLQVSLPHGIHQWERKSRRLLVEIEDHPPMPRCVWYHQCHTYVDEIDTGLLVGLIGRVFVQCSNHEGTKKVSKPSPEEGWCRHYDLHQA